MPWENKTVEELREEFVAAARASSNFSQVCRAYGITRKTGYKWLARSEQGLPMSDESRRPHNIAGKTSSELEEKILALRRENPGWGAKKIRDVLEKQGETAMPCARTVNNILKRNGCITEEESLKHKPYQRFEKGACNEMWQTDFKGEFRMKDGNYCYPLNILDDHSRYILAIKPSLSTGNLVKDTFERTFYEFGMPDKELLKYREFEDIADADRQFQAWREKYNTIRPHEALGMKCPADIYRRSDREYNAAVKAYEYGGQYRVVKVNSWGYVRFHAFQVYLSETMIGERIEFRANPLADSFFACYRNYRIAEFNAADGKLISRYIARL